MYSMSLRSTIRTRLLARKTEIESLLDTLYANEAEMAAKSLKEYEFESFSGARQKGRRISLRELRDEIKYYESELDRIDLQLSGRNGLFRFTAKRYI